LVVVVGVLVCTTSFFGCVLSCFFWFVCFWGFVWLLVLGGFFILLLAENHWLLEWYVEANWLLQSFEGCSMSNFTGKSCISVKGKLFNLVLNSVVVIAGVGSAADAATTTVSI
jgi:hypothetical protein